MKLEEVLGELRAGGTIQVKSFDGTIRTIDSFDNLSRFGSIDLECNYWEIVETPLTDAELLDSLVATANGFDRKGSSSRSRHATFGKGMRYCIEMLRHRQYIEIDFKTMTWKSKTSNGKARE